MFLIAPLSGEFRVTASEPSGLRANTNWMLIELPGAACSFPCQVPLRSASAATAGAARARARARATRVDAIMAGAPAATPHNTRNRLTAAGIPCIEFFFMYTPR